MKTEPPAKAAVVAAALLAAALFSACPAPAGGDPGEQPGTTEPQDPGPGPEPVSGYGLSLEQGSWWKFRWVYEDKATWVSSHDSNTLKDEGSGYVTATLGAPATIGGKPMFAVSLTGDLPPRLAESFWKYLGTDGTSFIGSLDGTSVKKIVDGPGGRSEARFFRRKDDAVAVAPGSFAAAEPKAYATSSHRAAWSFSKDDSVSVPGYDPIRGDECAWSVEEHFKPGIGPLGCRDDYYFYDKGKSSGEWTTYIHHWTYSLVASSLQAADGFAPPRPAWEVAGPMPFVGVGITAVKAGSSVFLVGGRNSYTPTRALYRRGADGAWTKKADIPCDYATSTGNGGAAVVPGKLYDTIYFVADANLGTGLKAQVYGYNVASDQWSSRASYSASLRPTECFFIDGGVGIFGDYGTVRFFDPADNSIGGSGNLDAKLTAAAAATDGANVYAIGQRNSYGDVYTTGGYVYSGSWSQMAWFVDGKRRWKPGLALYGGRLYVFGGNGKDVVSCAVSGGTLSDWKTHSPMLYGGSYLSAMVEGDKIYVYGCDDGKKIEVYSPADDA